MAKALCRLFWAARVPVVLCLPDLVFGAGAAALGGYTPKVFHSAAAQSPPVIPSAWVSREDGISALFPAAPERISAEQASVSGHAYQAVKEYESCIVLYTVTVIPNLPGEKLPPPGLSWATYFRQLSMVFADSIGVSRSDLVLREDTFGAGSPILRLEYPWQYKGMALRAKGFWIANRKAVFRVSATHGGAVTAAARKDIDLFLRYVTLIQ